MAVEYTSITTTGGWATTTVKAAWDLAFETALNPLPTCYALIDKQPERLTHRGDSQTLQVTQNYSEASITAAKAALAEELDVDPVKLPSPTTVTLTPVERGFANLRSLRLANRSMYAVDPEIVRAIADHSAKVHDEITQDAMVLGTKVYYGGAATSTATVAAGNVATAAMIRKAVTYLRAQGAETRDGEFYVGVVHPNVAFDLRQETGSGSWRVPNEYGSDQRKIWAGELGEFEGVRFIQNPRTRNNNDGATSTQVYRTFILGRQALAKSVIVEPQIVAGPVVDRLNRLKPVGWYSDLDVKIFRNQAIVRLESATAMT